MQSLFNKQVVLGVSGGIAAYKSAELIRRLRDAGLPVLIAIIPVLTTLISSYASLSAVDDLRAAMLSENMQTMNEAATASSGLGLAAYIGYLVVIVCGVFPSRNAD